MRAYIWRFKALLAERDHLAAEVERLKARVEYLIVSIGRCDVCLCDGPECPHNDALAEDTLSPDEQSGICAGCTWQSLENSSALSAEKEGL